jgi:hypothetical protein
MSNPLITVQDQFIAAFSAIDGTGNYETTVKKIYQEIQNSVPEYPSIAVIFAIPDNVLIMDDAATVRNIPLNFGIDCYIQSDSDVANGGNFRKAQFELVADIIRVLASIDTTYLGSSPSWMIMRSVPIKVSPVEPLGQNKGAFLMTGQIHIRNLNSTLT